MPAKWVSDGVSRKRNDQDLNSNAPETISTDLVDSGPVASATLAAEPLACTQLARLAWAHLAAEQSGWEPELITEMIAPIVGEGVVRRWLAGVDGDAVEAPDRAPIESIQAALADQARRRDGIYLTPTPLADGMASAVEAKPGEWVVDPAAGAGTLLAAVARRRPEVRLAGVEQHELLAVAAAINLASVRLEQVRLERGGSPPDVDRIYVGDGLAKDDRFSAFDGRAAAVVANPPYVREKGHRELFERLKRAHPHLADFFVARMDLQYLFFHRGASLLRPGGRLVLLTTAYWLTATSARTARADLAERLSPELFVRLEETGVFRDAPGQHSLLSIFRRAESSDVRAKPEVKTKAVSLEREPDDWPAFVEELVAGDARSESSLATVWTQPAAAFGADNWTPFVERATRQWGRRLEEQGTPLSELAHDRQGFVSGADRFSGRHPKRYDDGSDLPERGEPIFLIPRDQLPDALESLGPTVLRAVLRASSLAPNDIVLAPPSDEVALYVDGEVNEANEALLEEHLGRFRPVLEHRREVRRGTMPWYRLHWPRNRAEQTAPKLVVPRRAPQPCFALDLSASCVSSDCTYLNAPDSVDEPLRYLLTLMVVLNSEDTARYLRRFGKSKGRQLEFYSEPLRTLPLPLTVGDGGELEFIDGLLEPERRRALEGRIAALEASLEGGADR